MPACRALRVLAGNALRAAIVAQLLAGPARAQGTAAHRASHAIPVPSANAVAASAAIVVDGKLDDAAWQSAPAVTDFRQTDPDEGAAASERTEVRFVYDADALYVGARMFDRNGAAGVTTRLVRRDADMASDWFQIVVDAYHDHLGRAFFQINPSGSKQDALGIGASNPDASWDGIWEGAARVDSLGWTAELRIPFSQLRFSRDSLQTWGLQIRRFIQRRQEQDQWSFWRKNETGGPSRFGHLEGVRIASTPRRLEVVPYAVLRSSYVRPPSPRDPFNDGNVQDWRAGGDARYLLGTNLTLDLTVNPDFGQVEVDPAVVNLTAFETFYQEKRPFFVEGSGVFDYGSFNCYFCSNVSSVEAFYSRRVGRRPQALDLAYARGGFVDAPENSTILGAAKLTGRTSGGLTVGVMDATTRREVAAIDTGAGPRFGQEVEPLTNYFVGRVKRDYRGGNLVLGAIGTSVIRNLDQQALADRLARHSGMLGADLLATWDNKTYSLSGDVAMSNVAGDSTAILQLQQAPARYFQRIDRRTGSNGFLTDRFDPSLRSLRGMAGYARLGKDAGNWLWELSANTRTAGWETNDISFLQHADYFWHNANLFRYLTKPTRWYRELDAIVGGQEQFDYDGTLTGRDLHAYLGGTTLGFWRWQTFYIWAPELTDDQLLRGGPSVKKPGTGVLSLSLTTDSRRPVQFQLQPQYSWNVEGGHGAFNSATVTVKPASNLSVQFGPSYSASTALLQYVTAVADPTVPAFGNTRYVLSNLQQRQFAFDTRLNVTWSPTMTLELYMQPFIASGHYYDFKQFDAPRSDRKSIFGRDVGTVTTYRSAAGVDSSYTIDPDGTGPAAPFDLASPDFNFRSLRGNAVFRWEYRPGSTLFLVWTQSRVDQEPFGDFAFNRDRTGLFAAHPDDVFLIKLSYWLGR